MKVIHHENGDSEFELTVKVHKACSDKDGISVSIGDALSVDIKKSDHDAYIELPNSIIAGGFESEHDALDWLLKKLGE